MDMQVLCTSNLTDAVDSAFLDRADIKAYIGLPSVQVTLLPCYAVHMRPCWQGCNRSEVRTCRHAMRYCAAVCRSSSGSAWWLAALHRIHGENCRQGPCCSCMAPLPSGNLLMVPVQNRGLVTLSLCGAVWTAAR